MKTVEICDGIAQEIEDAKQEELNGILLDAAQTFIDVTELGIPPGRKVFVHALTGKKIHIRAVWGD